MGTSCGVGVVAVVVVVVVNVLGSWCVYVYARRDMRCLCVCCPRVSGVPQIVILQDVSSVLKEQNEAELELDRIGGFSLDEEGDN